ncbi:MAG: phosphoribosylformylglycinamidine synthase, partial [Clostridia bacterium]|nr:phosphoribosylformylglycinamidine synthase [Clostridia bacterium]
MMVYRVYVEKKEEYAHEASALFNELTELVGLPITSLRVINRYDVEKIDRELFDYACRTVFSEPQTDRVAEELQIQADEVAFAVEFLPGQFDQRADSAACCIALISQKERPTVRTAKVYVVKGDITGEVLSKIKHYVINPVESREAIMEKPETLQISYAIPSEVETLNGFTALKEEELAEVVKKYGLAMDADDVRFCRDYFKSEDRDPTITELRMLDTYWSDHCRHTTFLTTIDSVTSDSPLLREAFEEYVATRKEVNRTKPMNLMDVATVSVRYLKKIGALDKLDESEEINACTVKIKVTVNGTEEDWLLLFKNETHNHPTEIEPFGGAATCIGGAIRDPLSGRSYVYAAMRVTGAGNPLTPVQDTIVGKLPQRKIVQTAAAGYSSYGNQIGLATSMVDEIYDDGYVAKRMEIGAVIGAAPAKNVIREQPLPGDAVILIGGRTGRDGCGGATGSSKSHTVASIEQCGAEVQKGNAPEERKLQRLFRNPEFTQKVKRCNDFGAGGVSVAIGELADGLLINLDKVPKKYDGLDGTELAISESQERMAVVVRKTDVEEVLRLAASENLEATEVAVVTESPRLVMTWNDKVIVDISREFLNSNGAEKHTTIEMEVPKAFDKAIPTSFVEGYTALAGDLNVCSKKGLSERFDSTIGAGSVLMPFGGKYQQTPIQAMVHKISVEKGEMEDCSFMSWGYNPHIFKCSPYHGAYLAVVESVAKLVATGAEFKDVYLTFQEYFEKPKTDPKRWGKPLA